MARNAVYAYTPRYVRERAVPSGTKAGTPLLIGIRPGVTITARADDTTTFTLADGSVRTIPSGSANQSAGKASIAFDGTWEFTGISGVTNATADDVAIYITSAGALTTTATGNTLFGYTDYTPNYTKAAGKAPVRIGN